jgi:hypothetical protein
MFEALLPGTFGSTFVDPRFQHLNERAVMVPAASLTMRRPMATHHGRTLLMLGHAAEHLASSRKFVFEETEKSADDEAIHILKSLSRGVFEDYASEFQKSRDGNGPDTGVSSVFTSN